ncbi:hypothetical protein HGRIS_010523 [Hohenbuehelia grisea]|uniref:Spindle assembly checkpoint component MAD1 n=1 Tax=Hohenbuehelia grisea TaxID=104357 RepID=A0ABR3IX78_9AGAR
MTPASGASRLRSAAMPPRSTAVKRDTLAAELERDPQLSSAKRQQRTQAFTSSMAHASLERQLAAAQTAKLELETKLREREVQVESLERDRRWLSEHEKNEREEKEKERAEYAEEKAKFVEEIRNLRQSLSALREEHADLLDAHSSARANISSQKNQIATLRSQLSSAQATLDSVASSHQSDIEELKSQLQHIREERDTLERKTGRASTAEGDLDMEIIRNELQRQATHTRKLEAANERLHTELTHLRERAAGVEVLREEKRGLEGRLHTLEQVRDRAVRLEIDLDAAKRERDEWKQRCQESEARTTDQGTSVTTVASLTALRLEHAQLLDTHGATTASLRQMERSLAAAQEEAADAQLRAETVEIRVQELESTIREMQSKLEREGRRVGLADREVTFMKALLASYNAEDAGEHIDEALRQHVQHVESLLEEYKSTNHALEAAAASTSALSPHPTSPPSEIASTRISSLSTQNAALQERVTELEAQIKDMDQRTDAVEQELFELKGEVAGGRHVPPGTRVLCMRENPVQEWVDLREAAMERLREENRALLDRLKDVEGAAAAAGAVVGDSKEESEGKEGNVGAELVPRASWELLAKEKAELEDVVKQKEKRLLRLQQVFASKSAEFREAIASILGVKLAFYPNGSVRVTSMYDLNASFVFQPTKGDVGPCMQLIAQGEGVPPDLTSVMQLWIEKEQCIPGFLSIVTLECYEKQKQEALER